MERIVRIRELLENLKKSNLSFYHNRLKQSILIRLNSKGYLMGILYGNGKIAISKHNITLSLKGECL